MSILFIYSTSQACFNDLYFFIHSSVVVQSVEYINLQQPNLQVLIQATMNRCLAKALT